MGFPVYFLRQTRRTKCRRSPHQAISQRESFQIRIKASSAFKNNFSKVKYVFYAKYCVPRKSRSYPYGYFFFHGKYSIRNHVLSSGVSMLANFCLQKSLLCADTCYFFFTFQISRSLQTSRFSYWNGPELGQLNDSCTLIGKVVFTYKYAYQLGFVTDIFIICLRHFIKTIFGSLCLHRKFPTVVIKCCGKCHGNYCFLINRTQ